MPFIAAFNVPGYLPESEPVAFDSAREAWDYLIDERDRYLDGLGLSDDVSQAMARSRRNGVQDHTIFPTSESAEYDQYAYSVSWDDDPNYSDADSWNDALSTGERG